VVSPEALDLVVVPGVVFDQQGHRLGYGRGFYDRALTECTRNCVKVGFAFDFQLIETLPAVAHDRPLSVLMTEARTLNFSA
jgi:5-formyltetrahydrofolate cyclo-ligase